MPWGTKVDSMLLHSRSIAADDTPEAPQARRARLERRRQARHVALLRVAVLHAAGVRDLCVVKNISSSGLSARAYRKLACDEPVQIEFKSGEMLSGSVVWERDWDVGIVFPKAIDVEAVLASRWVTEPGRRRNLPRIELECEGQLSTGLGSFDVALQDISQGGARVEIQTPRFELGEVVSLSLPDLPPVRGVVRWVGGCGVGISFNECIAFETLARWVHARRSAHR
jgi:PilZ domain-containing protein